jgi:hypothetical protein
MNLFNRITLLQKLAVLATATGISFLISIPVTARSNPNPSIFNEFPYNRSANRRTKQRPKRTIKQRSRATLKKQPIKQNYRKPTQNQAPETPRSFDFRAPGY